MQLSQGALVLWACCVGAVSRGQRLVLRGKAQVCFECVCVCELFARRARPAKAVCRLSGSVLGVKSTNAIQRRARQASCVAAIRPLLSTSSKGSSRKAVSGPVHERRWRQRLPTLHPAQRPHQTTRAVRGRLRSSSTTSASSRPLITRAAAAAAGRPTTASAVALLVATAARRRARRRGCGWACRATCRVPVRTPALCSQANSCCRCCC